MYFLDTNICISCLRGKNDNLLRKLETYSFDDIKIPIITACELIYGVHKSKFKENNLHQTNILLTKFEIIPFDLPAIDIYGRMRASLESKGQIIGYNDMLIAASALSRKAVLVTNNTKEFSRIDGLIIEDWTI